MDVLIWIGVILCLSQSATFSGLNLALFTVSRLRIEVEASKGNEAAAKVLALRKDYNFALVTILWGNVGVNVLLALLSNSVLAGVLAFLFSTVIITLFGEIMPQAYFSRHALKMASTLSPILRFYQIILYPIVKPTAMVLDRWLGREGIMFYREKDFREVIRQHITAEDTDIDQVEGLGALNFLSIDDIMVIEEGGVIDPNSIIQLPFVDGQPVFPEFERSPDDPFLQKVQASTKKWVIITDEDANPRLVLDSDAFLREVIFGQQRPNPNQFCHEPIIVDDVTSPLGEVMQRLKVLPERIGDDVIDTDVILVWWGAGKRIITGADILGRLLRGISVQDKGKSGRSNT